ncbi:glycosyltransferase [Euryarchaeota archaeon]|nr:glycosyltransferase [Euryarchaeota archaeon]
MTRDLKILLLTKEKYPTTRANIIGIWCESLPKFGNEIFWIVQSCKPQDKIVIKKKGNLKIIIQPSFGDLHVVSRILNRFYIIQKFLLTLSIIKSNKIDIIQIRDGAWEGLMALFLKKFYQVNFAFHLSSPLHQFDSNKQISYFNPKTFLQVLRGHIFKKVYNLLLRKSDLFQPITKSMGLKLSKSYDIANIYPLPICASSFFLSEKRYKINIKRNNFVMIYTGKISRIRNLNFLIEILSNLRAVGENNIRLVIAGPVEDNKVKDFLVKYSRKLQVHKKISWIGPIPYSHIPSLLEIADLGLSPIPPLEIFINSSPSKCIEYLSVGLPVIANNEIIDQNEVIGESGGGLLTDYNPVSFSDKILQIKNNLPKLKKMSKNGITWVSNNRTYDIISKGLHESYVNLKKS